MRTLLLAAVAVAAAATSASAQTCTANDIAFITASSGPFATVCAAQQTLATLTPFNMAITLLLDPTQSTLTFLNSAYMTTRVNAAIDAFARSPLATNNPNVSRALLGWPAYPFSQTFPTVTNFSSTVFELVQGNPATNVGQYVNATVGGAVAYILCPTLKQIVRDLIACVPANCSGVVTSLCENPTPANAVAQLGATGGVTPFATGTLAVLQNIRALCGGAQSAQALAGILASATPSIPFPNTTTTCSVVAPPALVGTYQYPSTSSPTRAGSAAGVAAGAVAAVASLAAAAFAF